MARGYIEIHARAHGGGRAGGPPAAAGITTTNQTTGAQMSEGNKVNDSIRYSADESPPHGLSAVLGIQIVVLILAGITLTPIIVLKAAGAEDQGADWVVFAALLVSGLATMLQARPIGPFGAGYVLFMGTSGAFIAVSITAIQAGGLPLLGTLVASSALLQFLFALRLGWFRKIVNPTVGGTVIALIAVTVFPIGFGMTSDVPSNFSGHELSPMWTTIATLIGILVISLFGTGKLRLWGPIIGVVLGCAIAYPLELIDFSAVRQASWIGLPSSGWPGLDLSFGVAYWTLLPSFLIVTLIGALETFGDGIAIQQISHREKRPTDFKVVQGAVNADGMGNLLSGLMGTVPNTTYSTSISVVDLTGVGARRVGLYGGGFLALLAFSPKLSALLQAIPGPVMGAFIVVLLVLLFAHGIRLILSNGLSFDNGIVFGLAFWVGVGFQNQQIFTEFLPPVALQILGNGMTAGGITAILLSWLVSLKSRRAWRISVPLAAESLADLHAFARANALKLGWRGDDLSRLELVVEEAFFYQLAQASQAAGHKFTLLMRPSGVELELEMVSAPGDANMESLMASLSEAPEDPMDDIHLRILKHTVNSLSHQQFHNAEYLLLHLGRSQSQDLAVTEDNH